MKKIWFEQMSEEDRINHIKAVFNRLSQIANQDPVQAGIEFMAWLKSPEGALVWPYIWKPEYVPLIRDITYYAIGFVNKIVIRRMIEKGMGR